MSPLPEERQEEVAGTSGKVEESDATELEPDDITF
jgi:hypothetical protein